MGRVRYDLSHKMCELVVQLFSVTNRYRWIVRQVGSFYQFLFNAGRFVATSYADHIWHIDVALKTTEKKMDSFDGHVFGTLLSGSSHFLSLTCSLFRIEAKLIRRGRYHGYLTV